MPGFWDSVEDFLTQPFHTFAYNESKYWAARGSARKLAEAYNLRSGSAADLQSFRRLWKLTVVANKYGDKYHDGAVLATLGLMDLLPRIAEQTRAINPNHNTGFSLANRYSDLDATGRVFGTTTPLGLDRIRWGDANRNYVVFSDIHMLYPGNRQQFFDRTCNKDLYLEVLRSHYQPEDFSLVENGDVEELLVFEPIADELRNIGKWSWREVFEYRESKKIPQLRRIVEANRDYYDVIQDFHEECKIPCLPRASVRY